MSSSCELHPKVGDSLTIFHFNKITNSLIDASPGPTGLRKSQYRHRLKAFEGLDTKP